MVRVTRSLSTHRRRKRLLKLAKGFVGDRKNHIKLSKDAVMSALSFNTRHRKQKKRDFRSIWIVRLGVASKIHGMSYNRLIQGLEKAGCLLNRKMLSDMAIRDPESFAGVVSEAKKALA